MTTKLSEIAETLASMTRGDLPYAPDDASEIETLNTALAELADIHAAASKLARSLKARRDEFAAYATLTR